MKRQKISDEDAKYLSFFHNDKKLLLNDNRKLKDVFLSMGFITVM